MIYGNMSLERIRFVYLELKYDHAMGYSSPTRNANLFALNLAMDECGGVPRFRTQPIDPIEA